MKRLIILVTVLAAGALSIAAAGYQQPSQGLPAAALAATQIEKVEWRASNEHVLMTGPVAYEYEGKFDPALFVASVNP